MKIDNEDKMLIGAGVLALGIVGFFYWKNKKKQATMIAETPIKEEIAQIPETATPPFSNAPVIAELNRSKTLRKGSKGPEVKELQKLLGIKVDGDFGKNTLNALMAVKGVSTISLDAFNGKISNPSTPKETIIVKDVPLKKGQRVMVGVRSGFSAQNVKTKADGTYFTDGGNKITGLDYGDEIGVIKSVLIRADGLVRYVIEGKFLGVSRLLWVSHKNVALIK